MRFPTIQSLSLLEKKITHSWSELAKKVGAGAFLNRGAWLCSFGAHHAPPNPPTTLSSPLGRVSEKPSLLPPSVTWRGSAYTKWEHNLATHPYNSTQTHARLFARRLEEEIGEYKQHSPRPGSGFHGVLRHPLDSSHTQHSAQETHANLKAGDETAQTMLVNDVGSPLITSQSQTEGIVVEVWIYFYKHQVFTMPQTKEKMAVSR